MNASIARKLSALTSNFYRREAASFSQTRQSPWQGWERALEVASETGNYRAQDRLRVLDLACGNLRFEEFLRVNWPIALKVYAVDNCESLANAGKQTDVQFQQLDIMATLLNGQSLTEAIEAPVCDLAVAFGFMHHVPTFEMRLEILRALVGKTRPSGIIVVSFWQFLNSDKLRAKAEEATAQGCALHNIPALEDNDYLLGWQHAEDVFRYCHHFDEAEIDALVDKLKGSAKEITRFTADGKEGNLNRYLVLQTRISS